MTETAGIDEAAASGGASADPVAFDAGLCKACGICIELCRENVFDRDAGGHPVIARPQDCTSCLLCEFHCPDFALAVERRPEKRPEEPAEVSAVAGDAPAVDPARLATVTDAGAGHDEET